MLGIPCLFIIIDLFRGNAADGRIGFSAEDTTRGRAAPIPTLVKSLERVKVVQIAAGKEHSLVLSNKGVVYSFGKALFGRLVSLFGKLDSIVSGFGRKTTAKCVQSNRDSILSILNR